MYEMPRVFSAPGATLTLSQLVIVEANISLREDKDDTEDPWRKLQLAKIKVWHMDGEPMNRYDSMGAGHYDLTTCLGFCCGINAVTKACSCCVDTLNMEPEEEYRPQQVGG